VRDLGGLTAVTASHPHLTGASIQWSHAFGNVPVLVAAADRAWIRRPDPVIELWARVRQVLPGSPSSSAVDTSPVAPSRTGLPEQGEAARC